MHAQGRWEQKGRRRREKGQRGREGKGEERRGEEGKEGKAMRCQSVFPGLDFPSYPPLLSLEVIGGFQVRTLVAEASSVLPTNAQPGRCSIGAQRAEAACPHAGSDMWPGERSIHLSQVSI